MSRTRFISGLVACIVVLLSGAPVLPPAAAQERPAAARPDYVVEIEQDGSCGVHLPILTPANRGSVLFTVPNKIVTLPADGSQHQVSSVTVKTQLVGDMWHVEVEVGFGKYYDDGHRDVSKIALRTNERREIGEVAQYGVTPFRLAIVNVIPQSPLVPQLTNQTQSLAVEKLDAGEQPTPFRLKLANLANKDVIALEVNTYKGEQFETLMWPEGSPLIKVGGSYQLNVSSEAPTCAEPDGYRPAQTDRIELSTVVFADGTYEGKANLAAIIRARNIGARRQLERVLAAFDEAQSFAPNNPADLLHRLEQRTAALNENIEPAALDELRSAFPTLNQAEFTYVSGSIEQGLHNVKNAWLEDLQRLRAAAGKGPADKPDQSWLPERRARYERWLTDAQTSTRH